MKKLNRKRVLWIIAGSLLTVFAWTNAWADFYVVAAGKKAKKTILVSPKSTQTASGTALLNTINGITDAGESNSYLVIIEPGVYDIGSNYVQMKEYVNIQGSGEKVTKITGTRDTEPYGVLVGANNCEVRFLTVENTGGGAFAVAIYNDSASPIIANVTAIASGGTESAGINNRESSSPTIRDVYATASGTIKAAGISNEGSSPLIINVTASATGGEDNAGVSNRESSSPRMINVVASATGATNSSTGVYNNASSPRMMNVGAYVTSGATYNFGVHSKASSFPVLREVITIVSGGTNNFGVFTGTAEGSSTTTIDRSSITGSTFSILTDSGCTTYIGSTMLNGFANGGGTNKCVGSYNGNYDPLFDNCTTSP